MAVKTVAELKAKFETGDEPAAADFVDLLDSLVHVQGGNFPNPLPAVDGSALLNIGQALPDPLPAVGGENLLNISPAEYNVTDTMPLPSYATATTFVVNGDWTAGATDPLARLLLIGRRVRLTIGGSFFYSEIENAVHAAGVTTGTLADTMPGSPIQAFALGVITPVANGGAVGLSILGLGKGNAIASAATIDIGTTGSLFHITGNTGPITAISARPAGHDVTLVFDADPAMTHGASLLLPGGVSHQLVAGDVMRFKSDGGGVWRCVSLNGAAGHKPLSKDHGTKGGNYTLQLDEADLHVVAFSAAATLTIASRRTVDRATVVVKNGNNAITLAGIDNDPPTLTTAASKQDYIGLVKSFGKIGCISFVLNKATS